MGDVEDLLDEIVRIYFDFGYPVEECIEIAKEVIK